MATIKSAVLTVRVDPCLKDGLRVAAQAEHRSVANMIEVMIRDLCQKKGIAIEESHPHGENS